MKNTLPLEPLEHRGLRKSIVLRRHTMITIQHMGKVKIKQCFSLQRQLASVHRTGGAVRWMSRNRPAPLLTAAPVRAIIDEPISIKGQFLPPYSPVTFCARLHCDDGDLWEAFAHYNTKADGTVNLTRDHSVGGSYLGCEPMGLFWGLQPAPGGREGLRQVMYTSSLNATDTECYAGFPWSLKSLKKVALPLK